MKKWSTTKRLLCLELTLLLMFSLAACKGQVEEQDSTPPTASVQPTIAPTPEPTPPIPYTDVPEDALYYSAVVWAYENGIASDGDTFEPDSACTRGQVMTFLWRANGSPEPQATESPFSDVSSADWFYSPALWAYENGIATSTTFNPGNPCTNGEALTFLWRAEGKPASAVYSSPMALAAPDKYFTRPVAWAEANGLFAGADFDPAAPCSRADLMTYLYWLKEDWTFTEEAKTVQAEYEQIISDAQLFEVHGSGLLYADYVDADGDGKAELLTIGTPGDASGHHSYEVTATVYANIDGHAGKRCEQIFEFSGREHSFYICTYDGEVCFRDELLITGGGIYDAFSKIENGSFAVSDSIAEEFSPTHDGTSSYIGTDGKNISEAEYNAALGKYANQNKLFGYSSYGFSVQNRGLVPTAEEYQLAYWTAVNPAYAAVLKGDFSAFAGTYSPYSDEYSGWYKNLTLDKNGILTGDSFILAIKPSSVTITENGVIRCVLEEKTELLDGEYRTSGEIYEICPIGVEYEYYNIETGEDFIADKLGVQIIYNWLDGYTAPFRMLYYKVS
ncbi:MAG: S-layer homology domain-containing protein [Oscillospiraceae bacterium]|nr:S-layer homology domain-containing protein [Oscillospiraceae bacterium]